MWQAAMPAVTTKFHADGTLDQAEKARGFELMMRAGRDGLIVAGSPGAGPMLDPGARLEGPATAQSAAGMRAVAAAGDLLVTIRSNRVACRVDATVDLMERLADAARFVAKAPTRSTAEALAICRWFRPRLDLDVSTCLVQNIKLVEDLAIGSNNPVRVPRLQPADARRDAGGDRARRPTLADLSRLAA